MRENQFYQWLVKRGYEEGTSKSRVSNCMRVSKYEGDLDFHFQNDYCESLLNKLTYTSAEKRTNQPKNHAVPITGDVYNGTATFKQAVKLYVQFCTEKERTNEHVVFQTKDEVRKYNKNKFMYNESVNLETKDSYNELLKTFNIGKKELYEFGIKETIFPPYEKVIEYWEDLKDRIFNNGTVYIRGYGRNANGTDLYIDLYKYLFKNNNVVKDPTNNSAPQKIIQNLTGYKRNKNLFNYQVSHIYGRTKNIFMFEAPWNIALVPKVIDPFTGHETKGDWPREYQEMFYSYVNESYSSFINEYNSIVNNVDVVKGVQEYCDFLSNSKHEKAKQFREDVLKEFQKI